VRHLVELGGFLEFEFGGDRGKLESRRQKVESGNSKMDRDRTMPGLTLNGDNLSGLNGSHVREAGGNQWQQVFQAIRLRTENDDGELAGS